MRRKRGVWLLALLLCVGAGVWLMWGNCALECNSVVIQDALLPTAFDGLRIAQVSDLHNAQFGEGNEELLRMLAEVQPDIIAITGNMIDSRKTDVDVALDFASEAVQIAPCYYVAGNHESRAEAYAVLEAGLEALGVTVLRDGFAPRNDHTRSKQVSINGCLFLPSCCKWKFTKYLHKKD